MIYVRALADGQHCVVVLLHLVSSPIAITTMSDLTEGIVPLHKTASLKPLQPPKLSAVSSECVAQRIKITVPVRCDISLIHSGVDVLSSITYITTPLKQHRLDHYVPGILHAPNKVVNSEAAVIFISGAGGGTSGPAGELHYQIRPRS